MPGKMGSKAPTPSKLSIPLHPTCCVRGPVIHTYHGQPLKSMITKVRMILDELYLNPSCEAFREPVDWERLGLHDYPKTIRHPMDLGTARARLNQLVESFGDAPRTLDMLQSCLAQVEKDVTLTFDNCMQYNLEGSTLHQVAKNTLREFQVRLSALRCRMPPDVSRQPSQEDREELAVLICRLDPDAAQGLVHLLRHGTEKTVVADLEVVNDEDLDAAEVNVSALGKDEFWAVWYYCVHNRPEMMLNLAKFRSSTLTSRFTEGRPGLGDLITWSQMDAACDWYGDDGMRQPLKPERSLDGAVGSSKRRAPEVPSSADEEGSAPPRRKASTSSKATKKRKKRG
eukprot:scaffold2875_cov247-Pinguiococcus_pyrenoidosus.AAC.20